MIKNTKKKREKRPENSYLVAKILDVTPVKTFGTREHMTELRVLEYSFRKDSEKYYLFLNHNEHDLEEGDWCVFDVDFKEPVYDLGERKHYNIERYSKFKWE